MSCRSRPYRAPSRATSSSPPAPPPTTTIWVFFTVWLTGSRRQSGRFPVVDKEIGQLLAARPAGKSIKPALFGDQLCRPNKPSPRRSRQRTADTDAAHPECCDVCYGEIGSPTYQNVDWLRRHGRNHSRHLLARAQT